ncbi:MAG: RpiB/LacA/LacB family sugar-phosphate isomerase [Candidatus Paceibacterota bacterium]|jgi:ribose 5-phosphate isomerase B
MKIILAADHAGFALKEAVKKELEGQGHEILDVGAHEFITGDDYPVYMTAAAMKVAEDLNGQTKAILFGGSGQGEAMVANRFPGVRTVVWYGQGHLTESTDSNQGDDIIRLSREHNDANVLSIGARFVNEQQAKEAIQTWLKTDFSGQEKHKRRIELIDSIE